MNSFVLLVLCFLSAVSFAQCQIDQPNDKTPVEITSAKPIPTQQKTAPDKTDCDCDDNDLDDNLIRYVRFLAEPAFRLKGDNTKSGPGIEVAVVGAFSPQSPETGLSIGYYQFDGKTDSNTTYKIVPVMLRVGNNFALTAGGTQFVLFVAGGYSLNSYTSNSSAVQTDINNSYILSAQTGLKFPVSKYFSWSILAGYQYLNPEVSLTVSGIKSTSYLRLDSAFIKFAIEF